MELAGVFKPGAIACFPDGEAAMAPVEGTAKGKLVIDSSIHQIGRVKEPVKMIVENGWVTKMEGGPEAGILLGMTVRSIFLAFCFSDLWSYSRR